MMKKLGLMIVGSMALASASLGSDSSAQSDPDWDRVPIRRLMIYIEQAMSQGFQWTAYEQDTESLRRMVVWDASNFLKGLHAQGALVGETSDQAYQVETSATPEDLKNGRLNLILELAPVHPGEFVTMRLVLKVAPSN